MKALCLLVALLLAIPAQGQRKVIGPCFTVHGRLSFWNGNPTARIWVIGTHRMLGVDNAYPDELNHLLDPPDFDKEVFGDFDVCPLTKRRPGRMQMVGIRHVTNAAVKKRNSN